MVQAVEFNDENRNEIVEAAFKAGKRISHIVRGGNSSGSNILDHFVQDDGAIKLKKFRNAAGRDKQLDWSTIPAIINSWELRSTVGYATVFDTIPKNARNVVEHVYGATGFVSYTFNFAISDLPVTRGGKPIYYIRIED